MSQRILIYPERKNTRFCQGRNGTTTFLCWIFSLILQTELKLRKLLVCLARTGIILFQTSILSAYLLLCNRKLLISLSSRDQSLTYGANFSFLIDKRMLFGYLILPPKPKTFQLVFRLSPTNSCIKDFFLVQKPCFLFKNK